MKHKIRHKAEIKRDIFKMISKLHIFVSVSAFIGFVNANNFNCKPFSSNSPGYSDPHCYTKRCTEDIKHHIKEELNAAFNYLHMAVYFDQDTVNRPGLAAMLYEAASEEREHAMMMLDYLNFRGVLFDESYKLQENAIQVPKKLDYRKSLETSLNMEIKVTDAIYRIIKKCDDDFHGADRFTDPILNEQHEGVRKLQGLIKTFDDMTKGHANEHDFAFAEFVFDRKILEGKL